MRRAISRCASLPEHMQSDRPLRLDWLTRLLQDGIAFLSGVPAEEDALVAPCRSSATSPKRITAWYSMCAPCRSPRTLPTRIWGSGCIPTIPYREPVPGFQVLHALIASPDGGESLFADGFALAEHLRDIDPEAFALLTQTPVPFHYRSQNAELYAERPLIELSCRGEVSAVHYNSRSIAPLRLAPLEAARRSMRPIAASRRCCASRDFS